MGGGELNFALRGSRIGYYCSTRLALASGYGGLPFEVDMAGRYVVNGEVQSWQSRARRAHDFDMCCERADKVNWILEMHM